MKGSVYKRCTCPVERNAKGERLACKKNHGSWYFIADAGRDPATSKRRQVKQGGFKAKTEAEAALAELVDSAAKGTLTHDDGQTVAAFLRRWLDEKVRNGLRAKTQASYRQHIDQYFVPHFGQLRLRDLRPTHVEAMLEAIATPRPGRRKPMGAASVRRVHATLHSAMATAKRRRLISFNPATDVELPSATRPKVRPWEPSELGRFLDHAGSDELGPLFELAAATGLRRGEACGLRWRDVDLERGVLVVRQQIVTLSGHEEPCPVCSSVHRGIALGRPKTASGEDRAVELDSVVVGALMALRLAQDVQRAEWSDAYSDHDLVFAREDGTPLRPDHVTKRFNELAAELGLPKVRLHDLRHGWASLLLASGTDIALVSKLLGHSSISITSDTYSHLLAGVGRDAANRASALVPRASRDQSVTNSAEQTADEREIEDEVSGNPGRDGAASGNRTPDNLITSRSEPVTGEHS